MTRRTPLWVLGLHTLLVWIAFEDTVRKFLLNSLAVYLVKDVLAVLIVVGALVGPAGRRALEAVPRPLAAVLAWGFLLHVLGAFNTELPSVLVPLIGLRLMFFYVPLLLVGICYCGEGRPVASLLRTLLVVGSVVAAVGIYQALVDPSFLNPEPSEELAGLQIGMQRAEGVAYVPSTFLSPGRYVLFLLGSAAAGLCLSAGGPRRRDRVATLAHVAIVSVGLLTSGARLGLLALVLLVAGFLLLVLARARDEGAGPVQRRRQTTRQVLSLVTLGVAAVTLVLLLSERVQTIVDFYRETLAAPESGVRSRAEVNLAFLNFDAATWLFGHGTGSASYGIQYVLADVEFASEGGYAAIVWELGVLGLVFYLVLAFQLSRIFVVPKAGSLHPWWRPVSAALGSLVLLELWVLNLLAAMLQQYVVAIVLWLFTGIALGLQARPGGDRGR